MLRGRGGERRDVVGVQGEARMLKKVTCKGHQGVGVGPRRGGRGDGTLDTEV